jgi:hypothetical protein
MHRKVLFVTWIEVRLVLIQLDEQPNVVMHTAPLVNEWAHLHVHALLPRCSPFCADVSIHGACRLLHQGARWTPGCPLHSESVDAASQKHRAPYPHGFTEILCRASVCQLNRCRRTTWRMKHTGHPTVRYETQTVQSDLPTAPSKPCLRVSFAVPTNLDVLPMTCSGDPWQQSTWMCVCRHWRRNPIGVPESKGEHTTGPKSAMPR